MRMELVSEPGDPGRPNEDFASVGLPASGQGGSLVVLDGVTPPQDGGGCLHSVPWFTARLGGALAELTVSLPDVPLTELLSRALTRTADGHAATCDLSHPRTPQATVALARWSPESVEYLVLCDSALLVESDDGTVTALLDDRLARLPRSALATDALVDATVRNREGGFFTAAADPSVAARAVTGTLPRDRVRALAALTDGAARWVERFHEGDWADCLTLVRKEGARSLVDRVRTLERADADRPAPRWGKTHDDATVVYAELWPRRPQ
ncbi:protein phosphatase 2C domain-containing protein [Streptomyces viridosporus]|uniref:protein phosphatase 2C domain-containing protein n=1 Tax=Streptomyces viridosporus TaxID=67581 RepID=UPI0033180038